MSALWLEQGRSIRFLGAAVTTFFGSLALFAMGFSILTAAATILVGALASAVAGGPRLGLVAALIGAVAAYASAAAIGIFAYLGEGWYRGLAVHTFLIVIGYAGATLLRGVRAR